MPLSRLMILHTYTAVSRGIPQLIKRNIISRMTALLSPLLSQKKSPGEMKRRGNLCATFVQLRFFHISFDKPLQIIAYAFGLTVDPFKHRDIFLLRQIEVHSPISDICFDVVIDIRLLIKVTAFLFWHVITPFHQSIQFAQFSFVYFLHRSSLNGCAVIRASFILGHKRSIF
jgi:hypothetical protein